MQFDSKKGATWHCIVGRNFGSFVTHGTRYSPQLRSGCRIGLLNKRIQKRSTSSIFILAMLLFYCSRLNDCSKISDMGVSGKTNESVSLLLISYFIHWRVLPMTIEFCRSLEVNVMNRGGYNWVLCRRSSQWTYQSRWLPYSTVHVP